MLHNNITILGTLSLTNFATNGPIGTAVNTVDKYSSIVITQTTANIVLTVPAPTVNKVGQILNIMNNSTSTQSIIVGGETIAPGQKVSKYWDGSAWTTSHAPATVTDTSTIDMSITGQAISGVVKLSATAGNQVVANADGIYVAPAAGGAQTPITVVDTSTIDFTSSGVDSHTLTGVVKVSATAGNAVTANADGLYVSNTDTVCARTTTTSLEAGTLDNNDVYLLVCGGTHTGKKVKLSDLNLGASPTAPIMGGAGTTTVSSVGTNTATLQGTYTSDGGSAVTATGFVVYPNGTIPYTIGSPFVMQYSDGILPSPVNVSPTNLAPTTNYCTRPYATNSVGTSYGTEVCFTTSAVGYVTNLSSNDISIINLTSFTNTGTITGVSAPLTGLIDNGYMYAGGGSNFVTRIYLGDNSIVSLNLGAQVSVIGTDATSLYVATGATGTLHKINKATFTVTSTLSGLTDIQHGIIVGGFLYANLQASGVIAKIDLTTFSIVTTITPPYSGAHRIASDGTFLYVTYYISNVVAKIDISTFSFVTVLGGFSTPYGITFDSVTNSLYVGNNASSNVTKVGVSSFTVVSTVGTGAGPRYPLVKSGFLYVPCDAVDRVDKINLSTFTNVGNVAVGDFPCTFMVQK